MLKVQPLDKNETAELFLKNSIAITDHSAALRATEHDEDAGFCLFGYDGITANLFYFSFDVDKPYLFELLVRAALNYCANRGAFLAQCENSLYFDELIKLGFEAGENYVEGEIPKLLKGSCGGCG